MPAPSRGGTLSDAFERLRHEVPDHGPRVAGLLVHGDLPLRTRPFPEDPERVFHLRAGAEFVDHVVEEPLDDLDDQIRRRVLALPPEVDELAGQPVPGRAPLVLGEQDWRKVRLSRRSFHSFATIPWKMAAMHTTSSTRVHMSHTRNSSVGNL